MTISTAGSRLFREATGRFIEACDLASTTQWNFRPQLHVWSMGDVAEHVSIANGGILSRVSKALLESPSEGRLPDVIDDEIPYLFYRGDEPPNVATPTGAWRSWQDVKPAFTESAARLSRWIDQANIDLRAYAVRHPVFGLMDGVQWILFAAAHTERHRAQLIGLKREAG